MAEYVKPLLVTLTSCIEVLVRVMVALFLIQIPVHAPRKAEDGPNTLVPASIWDGVFGSWLQIGLAPEYALAGSWNHRVGMPMPSSVGHGYPQRSLSHTPHSGCLLLIKVYDQETCLSNQSE